jgi:hypothetical protein
MRATTKRIIVLIVLISVLLISCSSVDPIQEDDNPVPTEVTSTQEESSGKEIETQSGVSLKLIGEIGNTNIYKVKGSAALIPEPQRFGSNEQKSIDGKIAQYKAIIKANPGINFHAFYLELIENSQYHPLNEDTPNADSGRAFEYFSTNKPKRLNLSTLPLTSFEDHLQYYYRSDHHWNVHGMLLGYEKIYEMLKGSYPDISPMVTHDNFYTFPDIEFLGRWARDLNYQIKPDSFEVVLLDLPPYKIYDREGNEIDYNDKDEYLAGDYSTETFTDHYIEYNGMDVDFLEYVSENGSDRNLLIIGDSFTNAIEPLLASHYHHTYCVDIRKYPDYDFSFSEFLSEYGVDDVLMLGGAGVVFYEWRWSIKP